MPLEMNGHLVDTAGLEVLKAAKEKEVLLSNEWVKRACF
jgi:hypothetical protein